MAKPTHLFRAYYILAHNNRLEVLSMHNLFFNFKSSSKLLDAHNCTYERSFFTLHYGQITKGELHSGWLIKRSIASVCPLNATSVLKKPSLWHREQLVYCLIRHRIMILCYFKGLLFFKCFMVLQHHNPILDHSVKRLISFNHQIPLIILLEKMLLLHSFSTILILLRIICKKVSLSQRMYVVPQ